VKRHSYSSCRSALQDLMFRTVFMIPAALFRGDGLALPCQCRPVPISKSAPSIHTQGSSCTHSDRDAVVYLYISNRSSRQSNSRLAVNHYLICRPGRCERSPALVPSYWQSKLHLRIRVPKTDPLSCGVIGGAVADWRGREERCRRRWTDRAGSIVLPRIGSSGSDLRAEQSPLRHSTKEN